MEVFSYLKDRLWSRVQGWHEKHLAMAKREVLIKLVLQAIPTYVISCFKLPDSILEDVEKIIRRFLWGSKNSRVSHGNRGPSYADQRRREEWGSETWRVLI